MGEVPRRSVVTGAARGLGLAIATRLHADGGALAMVDRDPLVIEAAESLPAGSACFPIVADLGDEEATAGVVAAAAAELGGVDLLVNCAGIGGPTTPVVATAAADLRGVLEVNLVAPFILSAAAAELMIAQGQGGSIVNVSSILGLRAEANGAPYCSSKAALKMLTEVLALELAGDRIRVNAVAPGAIATEMHFGHLRELAAEAGTSFDHELERLRSSIPLGRHGTGADVAGAVAWLASADADYVTGQTIVIDGGGFS